MKKRMLAALLAGSMLLTACGGTGGQTASQAPTGEAPQSASADAGTQSGQKVTMKVSVGVADNHFEAVAVNKMKEYIEEGRMADYQDHYYPTEMAVDAQIQTFLMKKDKDAFLKKFDTDWTRYNRDIIRKVQDYEEKNGKGEN